MKTANTQCYSDYDDTDYQTKIDLKNLEYLFFIDENRFKCKCKSCTACCCSEKRKINRIKKKFKTKSIHVISLKVSHEIEKYTFYDKKIKFNESEYPEYNKLYILLKTLNYDNDICINFYTFDLYFYKLKSYKHDFLVFLAQALGAQKISWNCEIKNSTNLLYSVSSTITAPNINLGTTFTSETSNENNFNNNLDLEYENNGSSLYFNICKNRISWYNNEDFQIKDEIRLYLKKYTFFNHDFYLGEQLLIDFVRKRSNGMISINHEVINSNIHKTIFNHLTELSNEFNLGIKLNLDYKNIESFYDKTIYRVIFYPTTELEFKTLQYYIIEKSVDAYKKDLDKEIESRERKTIVCNTVSKSKKKCYLNSNVYNVALQDDIFDFYENKYKNYLLKFYKLNKLIKNDKLVSDNNIDIENFNKNKVKIFMDYLDAFSRFFKIYHELEYWDDVVNPDFDEFIISLILDSNDIERETVKFIKDIKMCIGYEKQQYPGIEIILNSTFYKKNKNKIQEILEKDTQYINRKERLDRGENIYNVVEDSESPNNFDPNYSNTSANPNRTVHSNYNINTNNRYSDSDSDSDSDSYIMSSNEINIDNLFSNDNENNQLKINQLKTDEQKSNENNQLKINQPKTDEQKSNEQKSNRKSRNQSIKKIIENDYKYFEFKSDRNKYILLENNKANLENKPNNNNYADCNGIYYKSEMKLNDKSLYINIEKQKFIGWTGCSWCLTGCQWLDDIYEQQSKGFGGFHANINGNTKLSLSEWDNYIVTKILN